MGLKERGKVKKYIINLFNRFFGFEKDIDITSEVKVLHRRNVVLKNITFISNLFYTLILFVLAVITNETRDWLFTALFFPLTFFINIIIKRLIFKDRHDMTKQSVAMYVMAVYIFVSTILFYARFYDTKLEMAAYVLIYYAVVVVSLYQSKGLTLWSSIGMLIVLTIIHFTLTYSITTEFQGMGVGEFLKAFVKHQSFGDVLLRTLVFVIFTIVVYSSVSIGEYMQEERRRELLKRNEIQADFTETVSELFQIILAMKSDYLDYQNSYLIAEMSDKLALYSGLDKNAKEELKCYVNVHLKIAEIEPLISVEGVSEMNFELLKEKTFLGKEIARRIQVTQKSDTIIRNAIDGVINEDFIKEANKIQVDLIGQIILMAELYIGMRSFKSYKRPYTLAFTVNLFKKYFKDFFSETLFTRF